MTFDQDFKEKVKEILREVFADAYEQVGDSLFEDYEIQLLVKFAKRFYDMGKVG